MDAGVDPTWAAAQVATGAFANAGQICVAAERVFVHRDVADAFLEALVREAAAIEIGPLIDAAQREHVHAHVQEAVQAGATPLAGGEVPDGPGFHYPPTVLTGVTPDMAVMAEETFGRSPRSWWCRTSRPRCARRRTPTMAWPPWSSRRARPTPSARPAS